MRWLRYILLSVFLIVAILFVLDNRQSTEISFHLLGWTLEAPLFIWLWGMLFFGVLLATIWFVRHQLSSARILKQQTQEIQALRAELNALKCEARFKASYQEEEHGE